MMPHTYPRETVLAMRETLVGCRVRLERCDDEHTKMEPGMEGTVRFIDDFGTTFVDWDNGSRLGMVPGVDSYTVL